MLDRPRYWQKISSPLIYSHWLKHLTTLRLALTWQQYTESNRDRDRYWDVHAWYLTENCEQQLLTDRERDRAEKRQRVLLRDIVKDRVEEIRISFAKDHLKKIFLLKILTRLEQCKAQVTTWLSILLILQLEIYLTLPTFVKMSLTQKYAWLIVLVCWAHQINLIVNDLLSPKVGLMYVVKQVLNIVRWFNAQSLPLAWLQEEQRLTYNGLHWALFLSVATCWLAYYLHNSGPSGTPRSLVWLRPHMQGLLSGAASSRKIWKITFLF